MLSMLIAHAKSTCFNYFLSLILREGERALSDKSQQKEVKEWRRIDTLPM